GYSEGRNITLDVRYTQGRSDLAAQFAAELVKSDVAMIVAHFTPAVRAAMAATKTIPIVMVAGAPLQSGFIKSLSEPGGNVTGLSAWTPNSEASASESCVSSSQISTVSACSPRHPPHIRSASHSWPTFRQQPKPPTCEHRRS